jgi:sulfur carrier protein
MNIESPVKLELTLNISINGSEFFCPKKEMTIDDILKHLNIDENRVAVALNESYVPRVQRAKKFLNEGDRLEILSPMVGG